MGEILAIGAAVVVGDVHPVTDAEVVQNAGELVGGIIEHDLFEIFAGFGNVFRIVVPHAHVEERTLGDFMTHVSVINAFLSAHYVPDAVTGIILGLDAAAERLNVFYDHGLLGGCRRGYTCHNFTI